MDQARSKRELTYRQLGVEDAVELQRAVIDCPPLSLHTPYTYWVMLNTSPTTCLGAWQQHELAAFVLAIPTDRDHVFVWQIGVRPPFRRCRIGHALLDRVWQAAEAAGHSTLETTIAPDNHPSTEAFSSFAKSRGLGFEAVGEAVCPGPDGAIVEREVVYRLEPVAG